MLPDHEAQRPLQPGDRARGRGIIGDEAIGLDRNRIPERELRPRIRRPEPPHDLAEAERLDLAERAAVQETLRLDPAGGAIV